MEIILNFGPEDQVLFKDFFSILSSGPHFVWQSRFHRGLKVKQLSMPDAGQR